MMIRLTGLNCDKWKQSQPSELNFFEVSMSFFRLIVFPAAPERHWSELSFVILSFFRHIPIFFRNAPKWTARSEITPHQLLEALELAYEGSKAENLPGKYSNIFSPSLANIFCIVVWNVSVEQVREWLPGGRAQWAFSVLLLFRKREKESWNPKRTSCRFPTEAASISLRFFLDPLFKPCGKSKQTWEFQFSSSSFVVYSPHDFLLLLLLRLFSRIECRRLPKRWKSVIIADDALLLSILPTNAPRVHKISVYPEYVQFN